MGWEVIKTYTDAGFSGSNIERPAMKQLLKDAANHRFNTILVYKLDRLSRSTSDNLYLIKEVFKKNNIEFVSLNEKIDTSDAMGSSSSLFLLQWLKWSEKRLQSVWY